MYTYVYFQGEAGNESGLKLAFGEKFPVNLAATLFVSCRRDRSLLPFPGPLSAPSPARTGAVRLAGRRPQHSFGDLEAALAGIGLNPTLF